MSYLVVAHKADNGWRLDVKDVGQTHASELADIETAARVLLADRGHPDAAHADLQLLMPDFELDLESERRPLAGGFDMTAGLIAGLIALTIVCVLAGYAISFIF